VNHSYMYECICTYTHMHTHIHVLYIYTCVSSQGQKAFVGTYDERYRNKTIKPPKLRSEAGSREYMRQGREVKPKTNIKTYVNLASLTS